MPLGAAMSAADRNGTVGEVGSVETKERPGTSGFGPLKISCIPGDQAYSRPAPIAPRSSAISAS